MANWIFSTLILKVYQMYLYLMDDITSLDFDNFEVISSLENLINTAYEGYNIIDAKRSTFRYLVDCDKFSQATIHKLKYIIEFYNDHYPLFSQIPYKLNVSGITQCFNKIDAIWTIPLLSFKYGKFTGLELLAEDESDAKLLIHAIKHHQFLNPVLKNFNVAVIPSNGGGANIKKIVSTKIAEKNKLLVCFCDSDKISEHSDLGGVTKECIETVSLADFPTYFFKTFGREIENDLPFYFIDEVVNFQNNPDVKDSFLKYKRINEIDRTIIQFADYKEDITYKFVQEISCAVSKKFWVESTGKLVSLGVITNPSNEKDIILKHISKSIASNVLDWLDYKLEVKPNKVHEIIKSDMDAKAWLDHGKNLFWLASGMKKGRL